MISLSNRVEVVLVAIFLSGLSGSVFLVVPVYISEICQTSIRGTMTSCSMVFYGVGMLVSYLMGGYMNYYPMVYTCLTMAVVSTLFITVLKETPVCLMAKGLNEVSILHSMCIVNNWACQLRRVWSDGKKAASCLQKLN